jgi:hypothetical protein
MLAKKDCVVGGEEGKPKRVQVGGKSAGKVKSPVEVESEESNVEEVAGPSEGACQAKQARSEKGKEREVDTHVEIQWALLDFGKVAEAHGKAMQKCFEGLAEAVALL